MTITRTRPVSEKLGIPGPSGALESIIDMPVDMPAEAAMSLPGVQEAVLQEVPRVVVICHPHPLHGGAMTNKVVHTLAKAFNDFGITAVRFNFRGVGASAGRYDKGNGETDDALAAMDWAAQRWPDARLWLGGFSFGGAVAIRAASVRDIEGLVTVAPAVRGIKVPTDKLPRAPWLLVQGDQDELVDAQDVQAWAAGLDAPPQIAVLSGAGHFFHGRLTDLRTVVLDWLNGGSGLPRPAAAD